LLEGALAPSKRIHPFPGGKGQGIGERKIKEHKIALSLGYMLISLGK
jgi:hypothetical protein